MNANPITHKKKKNVLILSQYLSLGGLELMAKRLAEELNQIPEVVVFFCFFEQTVSTSTLLAQLESHHIRVIRLPKGKGFSFKALLVLSKLLRQEKIDIIHSHDLFPLIYAFFARIFASIFALRKIIHVHTAHSFVHALTNKRYAFYEAVFARTPSALTCVSPAIRDSYRKKGLSRAMTVIENGVSFYQSTAKTLAESRRNLLNSDTAPQHIRSLLENHASDKWLLSLSRLAPGKGQDHLIRTWKHLSQSLRDTTLLLIVGPESEPQQLQKLEEIRADMPDSSRIIFAGPTFASHLWFLASDVFISASEYEGMPLTALEAVGTGIPALLSHIPGHEMFSRQAQFFSLNDLKQAASVIEAELQAYSLQSPEDARSAALEAAQPIRESYGVSKMVEKYLDVYGHQPVAETQNKA